METPAFEIQESFQALQQNESIHGLVSPFGLFQDRDFPLLDAEVTVPSTSLGGQMLHLRMAEEVAKNVAPTSVSERPRFQQQTFSGKPLSDEQAMQANQLASEFEDLDIVRRLFRR